MHRLFGLSAGVMASLAAYLGGDARRDVTMVGPPTPRLLRPPVKRSRSQPLRSAGRIGAEKFCAQHWNNPMHKSVKPSGGRYGNDEVQARIRQMTNWQRQRWNAATRPTDLAKLDNILKMEKPA